MRKFLGVALAAAALTFASAGPALAADEAVGQKLCEEKQGGRYEGTDPLVGYLCFPGETAFDEKGLDKAQKLCEKAGGTFGVKARGEYKCSNLPV